MFNLNKALKNRGWKEVDEGVGAESLPLVDPMASIVAPTSASEGPEMADVARNLGSSQDLVNSAAAAFSRARRGLGSPVTDAVPAQPPAGARIIRVVPENPVYGLDADGPGSKAVIVDNDRGIVGMQG